MIQADLKTQVRAYYCEHVSEEKTLSPCIEIEPYEFRMTALSRCS
jgi:hypothetical protein